MSGNTIEYDDFLLQNNILLLGIPKITLKPGAIYQSEPYKPLYLHYLGEISDIISANPNNVNPLDLPAIIDEPIGMDFKGTVEIERNIQFKVSLLKKLIGFLKLRGNIDNTKTQLAKCHLQRITYIQMLPAKIQNALENFVIRPTYQSNFRYLYVVTNTYFADTLDIKYFQLTSTELKILAEAPQIANGAFELKDKKENEIHLTCKQKIIFGITLAKIAYTMPSGKIERVDPMTFEKTPYVKDFSETQTPVAVYLIDKEDPKLE